MEASNFLEEIRAAAARRILFFPHAVRQMNRPERMITPSDVRRVVFEGDIIEDYPEDARGHSGLLLGKPDSRAIHVVCAPKAGYLAIITAYVPDPAEWDADFRGRQLG